MRTIRFDAASQGPLGARPARPMLQRWNGARLLVKTLGLVLVLTALAPTRMPAEVIELISFTNQWRFNDLGTDLGATWTAPGYDDSTWTVGAGALAFPVGENLLGLAPVQTLLRRHVQGNSGPQVLTYYFRTRFTLTNDTQGASLTASALLDDGAVFYLNGVEVHRVAMPAPPAPIEYQTSALRSDDISAHGVEIFELPAGLLLPGENILAADLHQGGSTSPDAVFALSVLIDLPTEGPITFLSEPPDTVIGLGNPFLLSVEVSGLPPYFFQWFKDGVTLDDATNQVLDLGPATYADAGDYFVSASNLVSSVTSRIVQVGVELLPIELIGFHDVWRFDDYGVELGTAWREMPYDDAGWFVGPGILSYEDDPFLSSLTRTPLYLFDAVTFYFRRPFLWTNENLAQVLTFTNLIDDGAIVYLNGSELYRLNMPDGPVNALTTAPDQINNAEFISTNIAVTLLPGLNLIAVEVHQFGLGSSDVVMGLHVQAEQFEGDLTIVSQPGSQSVLAGEGMRLSVVVAATDPYSLQWYKNGRPLPDATNQVLRIEPTTYEDSGRYHLVARKGSSELQSEVATVWVAPSADSMLPVVVFTDIWRYHDGGQSLGTAWRQPDYQDSGWRTGRGVFFLDAFQPPEPVNTILAPSRTHYFRTSFQVPSAADSAGLVFTNLLDDGAVYYLNGAELGRIRIAPGPVAFLTPAALSPSNGRAYELLLVPEAILREGKNVLAVEVHQGEVSTDTIFASSLHVYPRGDQPLRWVEEPQSVEVATPLPMTLTARVYGTPPIQFQWYRDGTAIVEATGRLLHAPFTKVEHAGEYTLVASNPFSAITSSVAQVTLISNSMTTERLVRGPYLQSGTPTSVIVQWRTDLYGPSQVRYGIDPALLDQVVLDETFETNHAVRLQNLLPDTRYYYAVGTPSSTLAVGPEFHFITAPSQPKPTRIWVLGDSGTGLSAARATANAYTNLFGEAPIDVWLMLGDNAYSTGTDAEYQRAVFDMYPDLLRRSVLWSTIGNHETYSADLNGHFAYLDIFSLPTGGEAGGIASGTERFYSLDYSNIHFVCLDSEESDRSPDGPMATWLREDLAANNKDWLIAFWHSPPYTHGSHNSDSVGDSGGRMVNMRETFLPILEGHGVDLVLCGHSHVYERSYLLDGHYGFSSSLRALMIKDSGSGRPEDTGPYRKSGLGPNPHQGTVYVVAGSSAQSFPGTLDHPAMFIGLNEIGSVVIDIDGQRLDSRFLSHNNTFLDSFTVIKGEPDEPLRLATFTVQNGILTAAWKSAAGKFYRVEKTDSLETPVWVPLSSWVMAFGATSYWTTTLPDPSVNLYLRIAQQVEE